MPASRLIFALLQTFAVSMASAFSVEDMIQAAAATTLGERCASANVQCLITARSIEVVSKEIQEYKRYKPYNFAIWLVNPRTGGTGVAYGCKDDTGFFDSNSYNKALNDKIVANGSGVNLWLYCDDQMLEDEEEQE